MSSRDVYMLSHLYVSLSCRYNPLITLRMKEKIQNKVSVYRTQMNVTQEQLASNVDVSRQTIIALEKGNYTPSILLALKIAQFFSMPVEKLFNISYEK